MPDVHPAYLDALKAFGRRPEFDAPIPGDAAGVRISARGALSSLEALVDPASHRILRLRHQGDFEPRALLDALCEVSLGRSVQDVSEHAALRLESLLRDRHRPPPVPGVVQPENAGAAFAEPLALARGLLADYARRTGYAVAMNTEEGPAFRSSSEWGTSTVPGRTQQVLSALPAVCPETGVRASEVALQGVSGRRVTLSLPAGLPAAVQQKYLTLVEMELRAKLDARLEVFLDDRKDANAIRKHALGDR